jgi:Asp-tRNA(Asn)/Glu-tRNA(Gln) amidotransferase A subunit family amidase
VAWTGTPVSLSFLGRLLDDVRLLTFAKANKEKMGFDKRIWF